VPMALASIISLEQDATNVYKKVRTIAVDRFLQAQDIYKIFQHFRSTCRRECHNGHTRKYLPEDMQLFVVWTGR